MCNAWNHLPGCHCGWGGYGHVGRSHCLSLIVNDSSKVIPVIHDCGKGMYRWSLFYDDFTRPAICPICNESVFFIRHNGGSVWLDSLGDPWPKHGCFDSQQERYNSTVELKLSVPSSYNAVNTTQALISSIQASGINAEYSVLGVMVILEDKSDGTCNAILNYGGGKNKQITIYERLDYNIYVGSIVLSSADNELYACVNMEDGANCYLKKLLTVPPLSSMKLSRNWMQNDYVKHDKFGVGKVTALVQVDEDVKLTIKFLNRGMRTFFQSIVKLCKIDKYDYDADELLVVCNNFAQWLNANSDQNPISSRVELVPLNTLPGMNTAYHLTDKLKSHVTIIVGNSNRYIRDLLQDISYRHALFVQERDGTSGYNLEQILGGNKRAKDKSADNLSKYLKLINKEWPQVD